MIQHDLILTDDISKLISKQSHLLRFQVEYEFWGVLKRVRHNLATKQ